jgi:hypothetical protein
MLPESPLRSLERRNRGFETLRAPERAVQRLASRGRLRCAECRRFSSRDAAGWRGYRTDIEEDGDPAGDLECSARAASSFEFDF